MKNYEYFKEPGCEVNCTTKSELEEEWKRYIDSKGGGTITINVKDIDHHFAEWQKQQMKETLQTEYEKGRFDMREEIMKDAVDGEYWDGSIYLDNRPTEYKDGDKVKIIIVKEECYGR